MPEDKIVNLGGSIEGFPVTPVSPNIPSPLPTLGSQPGTSKSFDDLFSEGLNTVKFKGKENIPISSFYTGSRFPESRPGTDPEEMAARQQDLTDKWGNSLAKFAGTTATSFVSGTAGLLWGIGSAATNWNFSSLIKNDVTEAMDQTMKELEDYAPNYYTQNEKDAEFLSSDNLLTANFWGDKVFRNLGYSIGSLGGGLAWSKLFRSIGITNSLVKAGKGMQTATALEAAMTNVPKVQKFAAAESTLNALAQKYIKNPLGTVLSDADRVLTSTMGTFGEASMEGLQNMNAFRQKAIEEYRAQYGVDPTGSDLAEIDAYSQKIGNYTWGMNTLLLSGTNYIQLPKILNSSRKGERTAINSIGQGEVGQAFSKMVPANKVGDIINKAKGAGRLFFSPSESFEEGSQYAIQIGTDNYFNRAYSNKQELKSFLSTMNGVMNNIVKEGVEETLSSKEGLESILIGGLSGGIQQVRGNLKEGGIFGDTGVRGKNTDVALTAINKTNINQVLTDQAKFMAIGLGSQKLRQEAIASNDKLNEKDYETDFALSYVMPRAKYGKADSIYTELSYYESQALKEGGFEELQTKGIANQNETRDQFLARIQALKTTTQSVESAYSNIQDKYSLDVNEDGKLKYSDQTIDRLVYAASKIKTYDERIPQVNMALSSAGISTIDVLSGIITDSKPNKEATKEALNQINAMDVVDDVKGELKRDLTDIIELSLRRKSFIADYNKTVSDPSSIKTLEDFDLNTENDMLAEVDQKSTGKEKVAKKELEVGKEYSLKEPIRKEGTSLQLAPKITVLSKTLGGEYEVKLPNGRTAFITPEEFKNYNISDIENASEQLEDILNKAIDTVLSSPKYSDISVNIPEGKTKLDFINSLDNERLINDVKTLFNKNSAAYLKEQYSLQAKKERIKKNSEQIKKVQSKIELSSGENPTGDPVLDAQLSNSWEDMKKAWNRLFTSTIGDSIDWANKQGRTLAPHVTYFNEFINNVKTFKNREQIKAIIITPNQEQALGLKGLSEMSFKSGGLNPEGATDPKNGFVGAVFIRIDKKGKKFFIDKKGEKIAEINGDPVDITKIVFSTMPQVDLYYSNDTPRFRKDQEADAKIAAAWWEGERASLFKAPANTYKTFDFGISKGIATVDKDHPEKNFIGDVIIDENKIATQEGLVVVSTKGNIAHSDGINYRFAVGRPVLKFDDVLEFLFNSRIDKNKAQTIYKVIEKWSEETNNQLAKEEDVAVDTDYASFLSNVLYWKSDGAPSKNKIFLDPETNLLNIGDNKYDFADIKKHEAEIYNNLQEVYHNVNNKTLALGLGVKFTELYLDKDNQLQKRIWPNYQSYLLASKNPDGSSRTIGSAPLYTNISKPTQAVPYPFKQKYAYFMGMDNGLQEVKKVEVVAKEEVIPSTLPDVVIVNGKEISLNGEVNTYPIGKFGDVEFVVTKTGEVNLLKSDNNENIILDILIEPGSKMLSAIKDNLKLLGVYEENRSEEEYLQTGIPTLIKTKIEAAQKAQAPVAPVVSDIEILKQEEIYRVAKPEVFGNEIVDEVDGSTLAEFDTPEEAQNALPEYIKMSQDRLAEIENKYPSSKQSKPEQTTEAKDIKILDDEDSEYRLVGGKDSTETISATEIELFKKWAAKNVSGISYVFLDNLIYSASGKAAWGVFEQGVAKIFKGGLKGTEYHEVFEAIYKGFLSETEKAALIDEFKSNKGAFVDRETGRKIQYADATDKQAKERIADDFAEFRLGKIKAKSLSQKVL